MGKSYKDRNGAQKKNATKDKIFFRREKMYQSDLALHDNDYLFYTTNMSHNLAPKKAAAESNSDGEECHYFQANPYQPTARELKEREAEQQRLEDAAERSRQKRFEKTGTTERPKTAMSSKSRDAFFVKKVNTITSNQFRFL